MYVFYIFYQPPLHFKEQALQTVVAEGYEEQLQKIQDQYTEVSEERMRAAIDYTESGSMAPLLEQDSELNTLRQQTKDLIKKADPSISTKDSDYVFLTFIMHYLPHGVIGLLIAVILSAAMSSTSSEVSALASTTVVDFYRRFLQPKANEQHLLITSKVITILWGLIAIGFALLAKNSENLIEAVNIVGSIFYGTILGIFLVAFFFKRIEGTAVFYGALLAEGVVITCHFLTQVEIIELGYLWYNAIGCFLTILFGGMIQSLSSRTT